MAPLVDWVLAVAALLACISAVSGGGGADAGMAVILSLPLLSRTTRLRGWAPIASAGILAALVGYHSAAVLLRERVSCSCLSAAGSPSHATILFVSAFLLLLLVAAPTALPRPGSYRGVILAVAFVVGAIISMLPRHEPSFVVPPVVGNDAKGLKDREGASPGLVATGQRTTPPPSSVPVQQQPTGLELEWNVLVELEGAFPPDLEVRATSVLGVVHPEQSWTRETPTRVQVRGRGASSSERPMAMCAFGGGMVASAESITWIETPPGAPAHGRVRFVMNAAAPTVGRVRDMKGAGVPMLSFLVSFDRGVGYAQYQSEAQRIRGLVVAGRKFQSVRTDESGNFTLFGLPTAGEIKAVSLDARWRMIDVTLAALLGLTGAPANPMQLRDGSTPHLEFAALAVVLAVVSAGPAGGASPRANVYGARVDQKRFLRMQEEHWNAPDPLPQFALAQLPQGILPVGVLLLNGQDAAAVTGSAFGRVQMTAPGYVPDEAPVTLWRFGDPAPQPFPLRALRAGSSGLLAVTVTSHDTTLLPSHGDVAVSLWSLDDPSRRFGAPFRIIPSEAGVRLQSLAEVPSGSYGLYSELFAERVELEAGAQARTTLAATEALRVIRISANFKAGGGWADAGLRFHLGHRKTSLPVQVGTTLRENILNDTAGSLIHVEDRGTELVYWIRPGASSDKAELWITAYGPGLSTVTHQMPLGAEQVTRVELAPWPAAGNSR